MKSFGETLQNKIGIIYIHSTIWKPKINVTLFSPNE